MERDDEIRQLRVRVARLENDVAALATMVGARRAPLPVRAQTVAERRVPAAPAAAPGETEASFVGAWFARLGAVAFLLGAGFGFKYAVDRGYIGPAGSVLLGLGAALAFLLWSEAARRREWSRLAQAVGGGGIALAYLSVWGAASLYELVPVGVGFAGLALVSAGGVALALRHDSLALALLATIGGFLDPVVLGTGEASPVVLYGYVLLVDALVLGLAVRRDWPALSYVAYVASWSLFGARMDDVSVAAGIAYATALFATFVAVPLVRASAAATPLVCLSALGYLLAGVELLSPVYEGWHGVFAASVGVVCIGLAAAAPRVARGSFTGAGVVLITIAVPIQFRGLGIAAVWTGEAVVLAILGSMLRNAWIKGAALAVMGLALADSVLLELDSGGAYLPDRLLVSAESAILVWQVAALFAMAWLFRTDPDETWRGTGTTMAAVGANALAVAWLSWEAYAYLRRTSPLAFEQPLQFTLSAIWAGYAVVLMTVGVSARMRRARQMSLALFAAVIAKMALIDLWTLRSAHRVIAFLGLGAVLLGCSVAYHRFREMIVGDGEGTATA